MNKELTLKCTAHLDQQLTAFRENVLGDEVASKFLQNMVLMPVDAFQEVIPELSRDSVELIQFIVHTFVVQQMIEKEARDGDAK